MKTFSQFTIKDITIAAVIAALYAALTVVFAPISYGAVQFRIAEALTLLPVLLPQAIPGLAVGCLVSNLIGGYGDLGRGVRHAGDADRRPADLRFAKKYMAGRRPARAGQRRGNRAAAPFRAQAAAAFPPWPTVGLGQLVVVFALGVPLIIALKKIPILKKFIGQYTK